MTSTSVDPTRPSRRTMVRFVAWVLAILTSCWAAAGLLAAPVLPGRGWTAAAAWLLLTLAPLGLFIGMRARGAYPGALVRVLVFRPMWYAQLFVLLLAPVGVAAAVVGLAFGVAGSAARAALAVGAALLLLAALAGYAGSRRLRVRRLLVTLPELPAAAEGLVVAQISDLHVGPHTSRRFLARVADAVRAARPELIAVTGDLVDDFPPDAAHYAAALGSLEAPLGVFAIPGNHEVYSGWSELRPRLEALPLTLLVNRSVRLARNGGGFSLAGTGDPAASGELAPDLARTLAEVRAGEFVLVLAHNPALWPALARRGAPLTLSGHTHWGQLGFERWGWCLASPFLELAMGAHARDGSLLYIHPGTNYWGIPFRLGHAAEVTVLTLRRGENSEIREETADELRDGELRVVPRSEMRGKRFSRDESATK
ncbi:MAG TPA: metallophosphoesterase [Gemmatimonadales bacterium]|nr:metallophosphoesterase [Gemmatimonadales bacterium]